MFERSEATKFRTTVLPEIQAVLAKHGLAGEIGSIKYGETMRTTITLTHTGSTTGTVKPADPKGEFEALAPRYGYSADWFGKQVRLNGSMFEIVGVRPGKTGFVKNCIKIKRISTGKVFVADVSTIRSAILVAAK